LEVQGGHDYFRFVEGTCIIALCLSALSLSLSVLSAAFRFWTSLQKLSSICFWIVTSVGENEEKANTIQPPLPPSCIFLTFIKYCKNYSQKKIEFFNKTWIKYEFLTTKNIKIHIFHVLVKNSKLFWEILIVLYIFLQNFI